MEKRLFTLPIPLTPELERLKEELNTRKGLIFKQQVLNALARIDKKYGKLVKPQSPLSEVR